MFRLLLAILFIKSIAILWFIQTGIIGLGPDEAQYWTWSQNLDFGYYSKPPAIAWQIWIGTLFLGNTELGVRLMAVVISFCLSLAVFRLAKVCRLKENTAFWAAIVMALSPLGVLSSLLATTDGGMVLFWTLSSIVIVRALAAKQPPNYPLLGAMILCGALFKWPIYLFWILVLLAMIPFSELRSWNLIKGVAISLLGLLPSVIWNLSHDWATFRHVLATVQGGHGEGAGAKGNFFDFLGAQASLLSPILFGLLILACILMVRERKKMSSSLLFCGGVTLILLLVYLTLSLFQKIQGNWCVFAYPTGIVLLAWYACEKVSWGKGWLMGGVALSLLLNGFVLAIPFIQERGILDLPYKINPFRHNLGWKRLANELKQAGYDPDKHFLFSDKYQMTSILSFYGPQQKRAYFLNLQGSRKNQFSYWPGMPEEQKGKTGFFVLAENQPRLEQFLEEEAKSYQNQIKNYFNQVEYLGVWPLFYKGSTLVKGAVFYKCIDYNGREPEELEKY